MSLRWASVKIKRTVVAAIDIFSDLFGVENQESFSNPTPGVNENKDGFEGRKDSATRDDRKMEQSFGLHADHEWELQNLFQCKDSPICYEDKNQRHCEEEKPEKQPLQGMAGRATSSTGGSSASGYDVIVKPTNAASLGVRHRWVTLGGATKGIFALQPVSDPGTPPITPPVTPPTDPVNHHNDANSTLDGADKSSVPSMAAPATEPTAWSTSSNPASGRTALTQGANKIHSEADLTYLDSGSQARLLNDASMEAVADTDETDEDEQFGAPLERQSVEENEHRGLLDSWPEDLRNAVAIEDPLDGKSLPWDDLEGPSKDHQSNDVRRWLGYKRVSFPSSPKTEATGGLQLDNDTLSNTSFGRLPTEKQVELDELLARQLESKLNGQWDEEWDADADEEFPIRNPSPRRSHKRRAEEAVVHVKELTGSWSAEENSESTAPTSDSEQDSIQRRYDERTRKLSASPNGKGERLRLVHTYQRSGRMMNIWDIHNTRAFKPIEPNPNATVYRTTNAVESPGSVFSREAYLASSSLPGESHTSVKETSPPIKALTSQDDIEREAPERESFGSQGRELAQTQYASSPEGSGKPQDVGIDEAVSFGVAPPRPERGFATLGKYSKGNQAFGFDGQADDKPSASPMRRDSGSPGLVSGNWAGVSKWSDDEDDRIIGTWMTEPRPFSSMTLGQRVWMNRKTNPSYGEAEARADENREFIEKFSPHRTRALGIYVDDPVSDYEDEYGLFHLLQLNQRYQRLLDKDAATPPTNEMSARTRVKSLQPTAVHNIGDGRSRSCSSEKTAKDEGKNKAASSVKSVEGEKRSSCPMAADGRRSRMMGRVSGNGKGERDVFGGE